MKRLLIVLVVLVFFSIQSEAAEKKDKNLNYRGCIISQCIINASLADRLDEILDNIQGDVAHFVDVDFGGLKATIHIPTGSFYESIKQLAVSGSFSEEYESWQQELIIDEMIFRALLKDLRTNFVQSSK